MHNNTYTLKALSYLYNHDSSVIRRSPIDVDRGGVLRAIGDEDKGRGPLVDNACTHLKAPIMLAVGLPDAVHIAANRLIVRTSGESKIYTTHLAF